MSLKLAHVVNPVVDNAPSDLIVAQPITFETMRIAREYAEETAKISLNVIQYHDEEPVALPECFSRLPGLRRSIADIKTFNKSRRLPLLKDILETQYNEAPDADYIIYTNVDIGTLPFFYRSVLEIIHRGYDAFVVNRRTIPGHYSDISEIPLMFAESGESHKGYDCFVFKRNAYPKFLLGDMCLGAPWVGRALLANMVTFSTKFREFRDLHLTFHVGNPRSWKNEAFSDYFKHNKAEYFGIFQQLEAEQGALPADWRSYLVDTGQRRTFPEFE